MLTSSQPAKWLLPCCPTSRREKSQSIGLYSLKFSKFIFFYCQLFFLTCPDHWFPPIIAPRPLNSETHLDRHGLYFTAVSWHGFPSYIRLCLQLKLSSFEIIIFRLISVFFWSLHLLVKWNGILKCIKLRPCPPHLWGSSSITSFFWTWSNLWRGKIKININILTCSPFRGGLVNLSH